MKENVMREQRKGIPALLVLASALLLLLPEPLHAGKKEEGGPIPIGQDLSNKKSKKDGNLPPFPIVIDQPGAYVLVTNLDLTAVTDPTTDAIAIQADRVTLDLGGFSIVGPVTCDGTPVSSCDPAGDDTSGSGIDACPTGECARDTTVKNGTVRGMFGRGVKLGDGARVKHLRVLENATNGIELGWERGRSWITAWRRGTAPTVSRWALARLWITAWRRRTAPTASRPPTRAG
jgi:hypothetical protein